MIWNFIIATENYEKDCKVLDQIFGEGRKDKELAYYRNDFVSVTVINWTGYPINRFLGMRADVLYLPTNVLYPPAGAFIDQELYDSVLRPITPAIRATEPIMEYIKYCLTKK